MAFVGFKKIIDEGDTVILVRGPVSLQPIVVTRGGAFNSKEGIYPHNKIIGLPYGSKICSSTGYYAYVLQPSPELWTLCLPHRTQILYAPDISMILMYLDIKPGMVVVESGTGSASLSHSFARTIAPSGHLYTFDFHEGRASAAREEMTQHGIDHLVTVTHRDVIGQGFGLSDIADAVFIDLPRPWDVVESARETLKRTGGRFCSFSPCIEQVQRTCEKLRVLGFTDIETMETLIRPYKVQETSVPLLDLRPSSIRNTAEVDVACEARQSPAHTDDTNMSTCEPSSGAKRKSKAHRRSQDMRDSEGGQEVLVATARGVEEINGHTGYLTFAQLWAKRG